ncbi:MAG: SIMPL domain-containing protein [Acidobacteriota bacterium]|nr:SIMPL domain-containing protein [Acidobacteriota bacterium]MDE3191560.1 SIMPL domain-containing protein [Acidobacteriota bacterium]
MKVLVTLAIAVALLAGGAGAATSAGSTGDTVTVTGNGAVDAVPDEASFSFSVQTKATTATAALARNGAATKAVIAAVEGAGVPEANVQTAQVSLDPVQSSDGTSIVAYSASDTITVTKLAIARAGSVVDAAVGAGATDVSGPSLELSDQDALYAQALKAAVANARSKAQVLADATGRSLGEVVSIVEGGNAVMPLPVAAGAAQSSTPIEAGTQEIDATVTVAYALG